MKKIQIMFLIATILGILLSGCKKDEETQNYLIKLANSSSLGVYLIDKDGYTLYFFSNDYKGRNRCAGNCALVWPYYYAGDLTQNNIDPGLSIADFDTINVGSVPQTTYKGWPLYYYAPMVGTEYVREDPGETTGEGVNNVWFVAKPDYTIMLANGQLVGHDGKNYKSDYTEGTGNTLYFTDDLGITLYTFKNDSFNINKFTKSDFSNNGVWPIYETDEIVVPSILDEGLFSSITVFGRKQLTYKGWPLYYFGQDNNIMGNNKGISFPSVAVWPVPVKDINSAPQ